MPTASFNSGQGIEKLRVSTAVPLNPLVVRVWNWTLLDFGRFRVVAKQLQMNIGLPCGRAVPDRSADVRAKGCKTFHPHQCQTAQGREFPGLGIAMEQGKVSAHFFLDE